MKKGSYGRSKLIAHSPIQRKWIIAANPSNFSNLDKLLIFYVNSDDTNINTTESLGSPIVSIPLIEMEYDNTFYNYNFSKIIQTYKSGCYFFAWVNTTGQIPDNQLLISYTSEDNNDCLVYTPAIEILWRNGNSDNTINSIRGAYIKNPALQLNNQTYYTSNRLTLIQGDPVK